MIRALWPHITRRYAASQQGTTLVEALVVILIISIIGLVTVSITVSLFNSNIRAGQFLNQQTTIESFYGFMSSRISVAQRGEIGLSSCRPATSGTIIADPSPAQLSAVCDASTKVSLPDSEDQYTACTTVNSSCKTIVNPLSVGGQQVIFQSGGLCYRIFYLDNDLTNGSTVIKQGDTLNASVAASCDEIWPVRGPNQTTTQQSPGSADYDEVLDATDGSFVLAYGIQSERPTGVTGTVSVPAKNPLVPFAFLDSGDTQYVTTDAPTRTSAPAAFYIPSAAQDDDPQNILNEIYSLSATAYVSAPGVDDETNIRIGDRYYQQSFFLNQLCDVDGNVTTGGSPSGPASGDLSGNYPNPTIAGDAVTSPKIADNSVSDSDIAPSAVGTSEIGTIAAAKAVPTSGAQQAIPNNNPQVVQFNTTRFASPGSMYAGATPNRLIAPVDGIYEVSGALVWVDNSTSGYRSLTIRKNGSSSLTGSTIPAPNAVAFNVQSASTIVQLNAGDYVELLANQTSGGSLNLVSSGDLTSMTMNLVSK